MNKDKTNYLTVKDHSVSGETFQLLYNEELDMLETFPQPTEDKLSEYYKTEDFISNKKIKINHQGVSLTQYNLFKKNEISLKQLEELKSFCDKIKIHFHATPTSETGINELVEIGVDI